MKTENLCDYGCNNEFKFIFQNGKKCCSSHYRTCPYMAKEIGKTRIGKKHTFESKKKMSSSQKGHISWNKGLTKETDERIQKASKKLKGHKKNYTEESREKWIKNLKGKTPWNKGKTAKTDPRILSGERNGMYGKTHTDEVKKLLAEQGKKKFSGENNPWYGKSRSKELSPRWNTNINHTEFRQYRNKVAVLTSKTYKLYEKEINPNNYKRTKCGVLDGWQLDHIISVKEGYLNQISPEEIARKENLQMLPWLENLKKG